MVVISSLEHPPITRAKDAANQTLFAFRPSCSYRLRFESWFQQDGAVPGAIMEIQSYHAMLACAASGAGIAMIPRSVLSLLPGHERVAVHALPDDIAHTATWLIWRRDAFNPNIRALKMQIIEQERAQERIEEQSETIDIPASEHAIVLHQKEPGAHHAND